MAFFFNLIWQTNKTYWKAIQQHNSQATQRSKIGRKGGIKSGQVKKERKKFKEDMELLLSLDIKDDKTKSTLKAFGIDEKNMNNQTLLMVGLFKAAMNGNVNAFKEIQGMVEQERKENQDTLDKLDEVLKNIGGVI